ncbi:MAG: head morphogenesis protein [Curvibacter lanceolatus]|uniref:phage minor head protein n=1 Tax=Curvibacter lanceolatus TaxID=86182 RepID=UPI002356559A|nr:phage minor head protein [Curvibacter lanceolatus]MBV5296331.1 head morphogenesis protein [Curvibacter lanceolatus]
MAGVAKADLLYDLHQAVIDTAEAGGGVRQFQDQFQAIVAKHGWTGWTGEGSPEGEAWRARTIYQTNMATSYAAGRYQQLMDPDFLKLRPYWRYIHSDGVMHPRPWHLAWHGFTARYDHPFFQTHFCPNGWGCQCRIVAVSQKEFEASVRAGLNELPKGWDQIDPKTGAQVGIDKGFDYAPGAARDTSLRQMVQDKMIKYPDGIATALSRELNRYVSASADVASYVSAVLADRQRTDPLWLGFAEGYQAISEAIGTDVKGYLVMLPADAPRHVQTTHGFDGQGQRPALPEDYEQLLDVLNIADELRPGQTSRQGHPTVVALKQIGSDLFRAVFEVLGGKRNKALALTTLVIKTGK